MRDVPAGWFVRYLHGAGASMFFLVVYLHMFRAMLYGLHRKPRELIWLLGMVIYVALMAEAFFGYLLPWGNSALLGSAGDHLAVQRDPGDRRAFGRVDSG